jgi:hypothetical protein
VPHTAFAVVAYPASSHSGAFAATIGGLKNSGFSLFTDPNPATAGSVGNAGGTAFNNVIDPVSPPGGVVGIYSTAAVASGQVDLYINGVSAATPVSVTVTPGAPTQYVLGALSTGATPAFPLGGNMYEFIVYNSVLSAAQRLLVHRYLGQRYGITVP